MRNEFSNSKYGILFQAILELAREAIFSFPSSNDRIDDLGKFAVAFFLIVLGHSLRK